MRILAIVVMFCILLGTGCGVSNYDNDIAAYKISEYDFPNSEYHEVEPLDKQQIEKMAKQLIPSDVASQGRKGRVILSSKDKKIIKDFQEHLNKELLKGWNISWSTSDADAIVTGILFNEDQSSDARKEAIKAEPSAKSRKVTFRIRQEPSSKSEDVPINIISIPKTHPVLFLFWTVETDLKVKKVLSATDNYKNDKLSAAIADLAKNLQLKDQLETRKDWKIALINKSVDSKDAKLITAAVLSEFVTTTVFKEMVNTETSLIFLDKDDTSKHNTELQKALWPNENQKALQQTELAKTFSKSTGANAVLIIEHLSEGHFDFKLMEVPSLELLAIGKSNN